MTAGPVPIVIGRRLNLTESGIGRPSTVWKNLGVRVRVLSVEFPGEKFGLMNETISPEPFVCW